MTASVVSKVFVGLVCCAVLLGWGAAAQRVGTPTPLATATRQPVPSIPTQSEPDEEPDTASTVIPLYTSCVLAALLVIGLLLCSLVCLDHIRYSNQSIGTHHIFQSAPEGSSELSASLRQMNPMESFVTTGGVLYNSEVENSALTEIEWQSLCFSVDDAPAGPLKKIAQRLQERRAARAGVALPPSAASKPLLFNVSGFITAGEIVAIMGESGSGKS